MNVLEELKKANAKRTHIFGHEINDWSLPEWSNAVAGETGELCNVVKKIHRGDYTLEEAEVDKLVSDEVADIIIYLDLFCQRAGIDLSQSVVRKFNSVSYKMNSKILLTE